MPSCAARWHVPELFMALRPLPPLITNNCSRFLMRKALASPHNTLNCHGSGIAYLLSGPRPDPKTHNMTMLLGSQPRVHTRHVVPTRPVRCRLVARAAAATEAPPKQVAKPAPHGRLYNFAAGPAVLPVEVLEEAQADLLNWKGSGTSVMEMSHRGKEFSKIIQQAEDDLRQLLHIPDNYQVQRCAP